ncbi:hypothetical protein PV-S19_0282 [Pacmanvirus S19]|nr:hypothetical protein PV-S19_0282 [Pacmanvirus S19]
MNRFNQAIISEFSSNENREYLGNRLCGYFNNQKVFRFLKDNLDDFVDNYIKLMVRELNLSDPLPGVTVIDQLNCFNNEFIQDRIHFIKTHVLCDNESISYMVKDGLPTSRRGIGHFLKSADNILETWRGNSGRGVQAREDPASDVSDYNPFYGQGDNHLSTGVVFCDQSNLGTQNHVEQFNTKYMEALNKTPYEHERTAFGVSNPVADARLLSRSTFRKNEAGEENGIPRYEARLYQRHLERDITEGLRGDSHSANVSGHDMSSLRARVDHKNRVREQYAQKRSQLNLDNKVEDEMRYS